MLKQLREQLRTGGIIAPIVEPGAFRTDSNGALVSPNQAINDYAATSRQMLQWLQQMNGQ